MVTSLAVSVEPVGGLNPSQPLSTESVTTGNNLNLKEEVMSTVGIVGGFGYDHEILKRRLDMWATSIKRNH
jgi:hypothetical protein